MSKIHGKLSIFLVFIAGILSAKPATSLPMDVADIRLALNKLDVLGSVLYIGAHPDDENTALLAYLSKEKLVRSAYLSLTRGAGGQNLIGTEKGELLGILRTQELLAARQIDGAEQFFSRAIDFGYSKTPEETIEIWERDKILSDMTWIIRKFQPDILITRFTPELGGHGHHRASAILALEAFNSAGDPTAFPEQLAFVPVWQPKRIFWNTWKPALERQNTDVSHMPSVNLGAYNELLGKSYGEISASSRSMHKSQGFGAAPWRGQYLEYFQLLDGDSASEDIFQDITLNWSRVSGGLTIQEMVERVKEKFDGEDPSKIIPDLLQIRYEMKKLPASLWKEIKMAELEGIIRSCLGLWMEVTAASPEVVAGTEVPVNISLINRSDYPLILNSIHFSTPDPDTAFNLELPDNTLFTFKSSLIIPEDTDISQPYWLKQAPRSGTYTVPKLQDIGLPENSPAISARFEFMTDRQRLQYTVPVVFKQTDPVEGEQIRDLVVIPALSVKFPQKVYLFPDTFPRKINLRVQSSFQDTSATLHLNSENGWHFSPEILHAGNISKSKESFLEFAAFPPETGNMSQLSVTIDAQPAYGKSTIDYPHIPLQVVFPRTTTTLTRIELVQKMMRLGYIMGSGDEIPEILRQLNFEVELLSADELRTVNLKEYDAIVAGIRAYNTNEWLRGIHRKLLEYVFSGGTYIVQYNVSRGMVLDSLGPFPFKISRDRVSEEDAPVTFLSPGHPILNYPHKITRDDFKGWIQERGLYFAGEWSEEYQTPISSRDAGEEAKAGGILYTEYGQGIYIYTGYSFFRQLPAGITGAIKLFANLIMTGSNHDRKKKANQKF